MRNTDQSQFSEHARLRYPFVFPLRVQHESKEPKPDRLESNIIPEAFQIPLEEELHPAPEERAGDGELAESKLPAEFIDPAPAARASEPLDPNVMPDGSPVPAGYHFDGVRLVRNRKGSRRPKDISSEYWKMIGPKERQKIIDEREGKATGTHSEGGSSSSKAVPKATAARKQGGILSPLPTGCTVAQSDKWEAVPLPKGQARFQAPAMPVIKDPNNEPHRLSLREMAKEKIQELEFKVALELFGSVARLVSKDEVARNPKAKAALDKEWNNLKTKGVWDESRVRERKDIVNEARRNGTKVHLGRIFEACDDPRRKFKGRTVFQGNNVRDENSDHALFSELGSSPASMEAAKFLDAFGCQPGFSKQEAEAAQAYIQALFTGLPTWLSLPRNRWPAGWEEKYYRPMVPLILALYGHPDSGRIWEKHLNSSIATVGWEQILPDVWQSIFYHAEFNCILVVYVDDFKMAGPTENLEKAWASIKSVVNIEDSAPFDRYFGCQHTELNGVKLPKEAHPFHHVFGGGKGTAAAAEVNRTEDYWEHDPEGMA